MFVNNITRLQIHVSIHNKSWIYFMYLYQLGVFNKFHHLNIKISRFGSKTVGVRRRGSTTCEPWCRLGLVRSRDPSIPGTSPCTPPATPSPSSPTHRSTIETSPTRRRFSCLRISPVREDTRTRTVSRLLRSFPPTSRSRISPVPTVGRTACPTEFILLQTPDISSRAPGQSYPTQPGAQNLNFETRRDLNWEKCRSEVRLVRETIKTSQIIYLVNYTASYWWLDCLWTVAVSMNLYVFDRIRICVLYKVPDPKHWSQCENNPTGAGFSRHPTLAPGDQISTNTPYYAASSYCAIPFSGCKPVFE